MSEVAGLPDDDGAQPQRTMLAWQRTMSAVVLGCVLVSFAALRQGMPEVTVLGAVAALAAIGLTLDLRRYRPGAGPYIVMVRVLTAVVALAGLGLVVAIAGIARAVV